MGTQLNLPTLSAKSIAKDWYLIKKNGNLSSTHWLNSWLGRWEIKNWTLLWCEAHFEVKMCNTHTQHVRTILQVEMLNKCTALWREARFEVKMPESQHV